MDTDQLINISVYISALRLYNAFMDVITFEWPPISECTLLLVSLFERVCFRKHDVLVTSTRKSFVPSWLRAPVISDHRPVVPNMRS